MRRSALLLGLFCLAAVLRMRRKGHINGIDGGQDLPSGGSYSIVGPNTHGA